jgi:hypothetical protein
MKMDVATGTQHVGQRKISDVPILSGLETHLASKLLINELFELNLIDP